MNGNYLLEVNLCLALVILFYRIALQGLTFFTANRLYLLFGMLFSIVAPALRIQFLSGAWENQDEISAFFLPGGSSVGQISGQPTQFHWDSVLQILWIIYGCICTWYLYKLLADLYAVIRLIRKYPVKRLGNARLVFIDDEMPVSSFLNYIFINSSQSNRENLRTCVAHEFVHCGHAHTIDWLLIRSINIFCWFNPLMRFWREAIMANHEFTADAYAARQAGRFAYTHLLLHLASSTRISTLHYFSYYGQIKSRITMLHQTPSEAINRLRFLVAIPLAALMLLFVSCEKNTEPASGITQYLNKDLIGIWENMNRVTVNDNDGKTPRDFPERSGNVKVCLSKLELRSDGRFEMYDESNATNLSGTWQSNRVGDAIQLLCDNAQAGNGVISLQIKGIEAGSMAALQHYPADAQLSSGSVFYKYRKL